MSNPICCGKVAGRISRSENGTQRYRCNLCGTTDFRDHSNPEAIKKQKKNARVIRAKIKQGVKRFVITCAQNNTPINKPFFSSLRKYCNHNNAELIIIAGHYKNINAYSSNEDYHEFWVSEVMPYLTEGRIDLGGNIIVRGDVRIACTTLNPLVGKEPIEGDKWTVYGHPQFALEPVACHRNKTPKHMFTTGCITNKNYSKSNIGARAEFHHVNGALVIEVSGGKCFVRQLNADKDGDFYDLDYHYFPNKKPARENIEGLVPGDEHVKFNSLAVRKATYDNADSMTAILNPKYIVRHDVLDGYAGSHHHLYNSVLQYEKFKSGDNDYRAELDQAVAFINDTTPKGCTTLLVDSNHHDHIDKWLDSVNYKTDHINSILILELALQQRRNADIGETTKAFLIYLKDRLNCKYKFLSSNEPFFVGNVGVDQHGHIGTNGSRGSAKGLAKISVKLMIGHGHGSRIIRGVYQVGVSTDAMGYEKGMGDHSHTHGLIYKNSKRSLITIRDGQWRG